MAGDLVPERVATGWVPTRWRTRLVVILAALIAFEAANGVAVVLWRTAGRADAGAGAGTVGDRLPGPGGLPAPSGQAPPVKLRIPSIGVDTSLVRLHVEDDGELQVPGEFSVAGWWSEGTAPGAAGPAVMVGHRDSFTGEAVFYRLSELKPDARIEVERADGSTVTFAVDGRRQFTKADVPTDLIYGPTPGPTLRLITCGGPFDRRKGTYRDNVVVFAHLISAPELAGAAPVGAAPPPDPKGITR